MSGRLKAIVLLAIALLKTLIRRAFGMGRKGLAAFHDNYAADRLPAVNQAQRAAMNGFGGCIACGLCDRGEGDRIAESAGAYSGVMSIVLAGSRSMPDYEAAAASLAHVSDEVLASKEASCPTGVPIRQVAAFVRDKAAELRESLPPGTATGQIAR